MADFGIVCMWWNGMSFLGVILWWNWGLFQIETLQIMLCTSWLPFPYFFFGQLKTRSSNWPKSMSWIRSDGTMYLLRIRMVYRFLYKSHIHTDDPKLGRAQLFSMKTLQAVFSCIYPPPPRKFRHRYWKLYLWKRRLLWTMVILGTPWKTSITSWKIS